MQQHESKMGKPFRVALRAIRGFKKDHPELAALSNTAWTFAYSVLWNSTQFSSKEIQAAKEKITAYLRLATDPRKAFLIFCQRVLLARFLHYPVADDCMPLPSDWLDRTNKKGFAATKQWYNNIKMLRESLPQFQYELKALAEAVLEFGEEPTGKNFRYWKSYFTERQASGLLQLFQVYAVNFLFAI